MFESLPLRQLQKPADAGFFVGYEVGDRPARLRRSFTMLRYATGITVMLAQPVLKDFPIGEYSLSCIPTKRQVLVMRRKPT